MPKPLDRALKGVLCALPLLLAACGGGGSDADRPPAASCNVPDRQAWLRNYFLDDYLWYRLSPSPAPAGYADLGTYFDALLYAGGDLIPNGGGARWPADRYSGFQSTESFNRFFGDGQTLGWGVAVSQPVVAVAGYGRAGYAESQRPHKLGLRGCFALRFRWRQS